MRLTELAPRDFADRLCSVAPERAPDWLAQLPTLVETAMTRWRLRPTGEVWHGLLAVVLPVRREDGIGAALKVAFPDDESAGESLALSTWDGRRAVRLLAEDTELNALLLELLDADRSLAREHIDTAVDVLADLTADLSVPAPTGLRSLRTTTALLSETLPDLWRELGRPGERRQVDAAIAVCRELGPQTRALLLNEDLHFDNVLWGREQWLVIDPKPLVGDPEWAVIPALWNRIDEGDPLRRFDRIVERGGLEQDRAVGWTFVRAVHNGLWARGCGSEWLASSCTELAGRLSGRLPGAVG